MAQSQVPTGPQGPICQSCSMPLASDEDFGTEAGGGHSEKYCHYCYADGAFTSDLSVDEMVGFVARGMGTAEPEGQAREQVIGMLSQLERWREN